MLAHGGTIHSGTWCHHVSSLQRHPSCTLHTHVFNYLLTGYGVTMFHHCKSYPALITHMSLIVFSQEMVLQTWTASLIWEFPKVWIHSKFQVISSLSKNPFLWFHVSHLKGRFGGCLASPPTSWPKQCRFKETSFCFRRWCCICISVSGGGVAAQQGRTLLGMQKCALFRENDPFEEKGQHWTRGD